MLWVTPRPCVQGQETNEGLQFKRCCSPASVSRYESTNLLVKCRSPAAVCYTLFYSIPEPHTAPLASIFPVYDSAWNSKCVLQMVMLFQPRTWLICTSK
ncbi:hypothetical protein PR048_009346 [Dryococelus australis]|uniref:Uncharacterized protein n=1 Tax=Dryococelus australis TaxID=614101 RepID=A0ABQ9HZL7_9NEOP|nr:hypothetical protein PR048_009346 [Dryococelus australis]